MVKPHLSIGILTYNHSQHLECCLASVHDLARFFELEVVVVDDGSTDNTAQILEKCLAKYKLSSFLHQHQGIKYINANTEKIIENCANECIVSIAGDDVLIPEEIKRAYDIYWKEGYNYLWKRPKND